MTTEAAVGGASSPEALFGQELALWRRLIPADDALSTLAASHGVRQFMTSLPLAAAGWRWTDAPAPDDPTGLNALKPVAAPVEILMLGDGDTRSAPSPVTGLNRYGCAPLPRPGLIAFSACSGNEPGAAGLAAAHALRLRLMESAVAGALASARATIADEQIGRIARLMGIDPPPRHGVSLVESGTAAVGLAARHLTAGAGPCLYLVVGALETGRDVPEAVRVADTVAVDVVEIRDPESALPLPSQAIEHMLEQKIAQAQGQGKRVILQVLEGSKTGLVTPGVQCVRRLLARFPEGLDIVADFCQMRPGAAIKPYLDLGAAIVATGSKFLGGPVFSGIVILPDADAPTTPTVGTLLRWEAALAESRDYFRLPPDRQAEGLNAFAASVRDRCRGRAGLVPVADSSPAHIVTLRVLDRDGLFLDMDRLRALHDGLVARRCLIGQPVAVGKGAALRLAISAGRAARSVLDPMGKKHLDEDIAAILDHMDALR